MIPHYGVAAGITSIHTLVIVDIITICGIAAVIHSASMRNMCIIVITFRYISCRRRNHRTGSTHSGGEHSDQGFPCCSLFHSIIPLKLFFIVVCLLLLWKRSRCVHCVVMRIGTTSSEIFGICLSILYHAFCRKSIVGFAKEYVHKLYTLTKRLCSTAHLQKADCIPQILPPAAYHSAK